MSCFSFQHKMIGVAFIMNSLPHVGQTFHVLLAINLVLMELCCQCTLCIYRQFQWFTVWYFSIMVWCLFPCYTLSLKVSRSSSPNAWKLCDRNHKVLDMFSLFGRHIWLWECGMCESQLSKRFNGLMSQCIRCVYVQAAWPERCWAAETHFSPPADSAHSWRKCLPSRDLKQRSGVTP